MWANWKLGSILIALDKYSTLLSHCSKLTQAKQILLLIIALLGVIFKAFKFTFIFSLYLPDFINAKHSLINAFEVVSFLLVEILVLFNEELLIFLSQNKNAST